MMNVGTGAAPAAGWALGSGKLPGGGEVLSILDVLWSGYPPRPPLPRPLPLPRVLGSLWWLTIVAATIHMCLSHDSWRTTSWHLLSAKSTCIKHAGVIATMTFKVLSARLLRLDQCHMGQARQKQKEHQSCYGHCLQCAC